MPLIELISAPSPLLAKQSSLIKKIMTYEVIIKKIMTYFIIKKLMTD